MYLEKKEIRRLNLDRAIKLAGSAAKLSDLADISPSEISQMKNKEHSRNIGDIATRKIESALNLEKGWMDQLHGDIEKEKYLNVNKIDTDYKIVKKVPLISWVSAGAWCEAIDNHSTDDAQDWLPCPKTCSANTYALKVNGDSMTSAIPGAKSYPDGCVIYVDPLAQPGNGSRVIAKLPGSNEVTFKTYKEDAGKKWLMPINPQYEKILIDEIVVICGVIIAKYEPE